MQLFGGKMFGCSSPDVEYPEGKAVCSGSYVVIANGVLQPRGWIKPEHNFDTAYFALLSVIYSIVVWSQIIH